MVLILFLYLLMYVDNVFALRSEYSKRLNGLKSFESYHHRYSRLYANNLPEKLSIEATKVLTTELNSLIEGMDIKDKYSFLIQSIATKVIESDSKGPVSTLEFSNVDRNTGNSTKSSNFDLKVGETSADMLTTLHSLYLEMISTVNDIPTAKSTQSLIDATSRFRDCSKLGYSLQLARAGGAIKVFGSAVGLLTLPTLSINDMKLIREKVPEDNREQEIFYSGVVVGGGFVYALIQAISWFDDDMKPWVALVSIFAGVVLTFDLFLRQASGIKMALAGFDRLLLRDSERQAHSDASALLLGYLLGLPCFCFQPDVTEALKMLKDDSNTLNVYKQPIGSKKLMVLDYSNINSNLEKNLDSMDSNKKGIQNLLTSMIKNSYDNISRKSTLQTTEKTIEDDGNDRIKTEIEKENEKRNESDRIMSLGRVLVWLMAPVAAEQLKYGKTILTDPRRCERLLSILKSYTSTPDNILIDTIIASKSTTDPLMTYSVPSDSRDRSSLVEWAYSEAMLLVKQYGDLLEEVRAYIMTGTATVGECVLLVEDELLR